MSDDSRWHLRADCPAGAGLGWRGWQRLAWEPHGVLRKARRHGLAGWCRRLGPNPKEAMHTACISCLLTRRGRRGGAWRGLRLGPGCAHFDPFCLSRFLCRAACRAARPPASQPALIAAPGSPSWQAAIPRRDPWLRFFNASEKKCVSGVVAVLCVVGRYARRPPGKGRGPGREGCQVTCVLAWRGPGVPCGGGGCSGPAPPAGPSAGPAAVVGGVRDHGVERRGGAVRAAGARRKEKERPQSPALQPRWPAVRDEKNAGWERERETARASRPRKKASE